MNQITAPDFIKVFITNKEQRNSFVSQVIEAVDSGYLNPLDVQVGLKGMEKISESITKDAGFKHTLLTVAGTHGKVFDYKGAKIETVEAGVKYDYSQCNDPMLKEIEAQMERLTAALKERQTFLKALPVSGVEVITQDGEVLTVYPPSKSSTTTLKVTL